jgi:ribosome recycling factor
MKEILAHAEDRMKKSIAALADEFAAIRAGRANPAVLEKVRVDYYGAPTSISQLAAVAVSEARVLTIQPWDLSICHAIEKAIQTSDIGINPQSDGKVIRLTFPQLTEERRRDLVKDISKMSEECKIAVRNIRRDAMDKLKVMKKNTELTEDDLKQAEKKTQDLTDKYCKEIDGIFERKQKEIMEI